MRVVERERATLIPGTGQIVRPRVVEWVCPECDYFEEVLDGDESAR